MRALLVDSVPLSFGGGYERFLVQLDEHLRASGATCTIVTPRRAVLTKTRVVMPGRVSEAPVPSPAVRSSWRSLREAIARSDVIYLKNEPHELLGIFSLRPRPPVVVGLHSAVTKGSDGDDLGSRIYRSRAYGRLLRRTDHIHALQQEQADWCTNEHHVDSSQVSVIPNGVDLEHFRPAPRGGGPCRLLFVGRLDQHKGADILVSAVRQIAHNRGWVNARLTVAGDGPLLEEMMQLARDVPQVEVRGYVKDIALLMQGHDVLIVPSRWEAMALVPLEGLASGLPLIVSDIASFDQLVGPAVTRTRACDPSDLARAIMDATSGHLQGPASGAERAVEARRLAAAQFGSERSLAALLSLLERCSQGRR